MASDRSVTWGKWTSSVFRKEPYRLIAAGRWAATVAARQDRTPAAGLPPRCVTGLSLASLINRSGVHPGGGPASCARLASS